MILSSRLPSFTALLSTTASQPKTCSAQAEDQVNLATAGLNFTFILISVFLPTRATCCSDTELMEPTVLDSAMKVVGLSFIEFVKKLD